MAKRAELFSQIPVAPLPSAVAPLASVPMRLPWMLLSSEDVASIP
jgi:hypothetical protein